MILKEIYLYPDLGEFSDEIIHPFRGQSRSICNFLERHRGAEKFETPNFKKICFVGTRQAVNEPCVNSSGALIVNVMARELAPAGRQSRPRHPILHQRHAVSIVN